MSWNPMRVSWRGLQPVAPVLNAGTAAMEAAPPPDTGRSRSMLDVEFAQLSDCGRVRDHNEDFLGYVFPATPEHARTTGWLFALADGVGGQDLGEVASRAAVDCLLAGFRAAAGGEAPGTLLPRLVQAANTHVFET